MRNRLGYVGKALLLELIAILLPCMVLWFHTGNSRGLQGEDIVTADKTRILVNNQSMDVETFLIHVISVDYQPEMEEEALKALAVAARSHVYAHLNWYDSQQLRDGTEPEGESLSMLDGTEPEGESLSAFDGTESGGESLSAFDRTEIEKGNSPEFKIVEADQLGIAYQTPSEMVYSLQKLGSEKHWSEIYQEIKKAVDATAGEYLTCSGGTLEGQEDSIDSVAETELSLPVDALWHAVSAGYTRFYEGNQTGIGDGISLYSPELKAMDGKDGMLSQSVKIVVYTRRQLAKYLWEISGTENILEEGSSLCSLFTIEERDHSGYIEELSIGNRKMTGDEAAQLLQLPSSCFYISDVGDSIKFVVFGSGTGYGMSLSGASVMASQGVNYKEILEYYFPVCQIE